MMGKIFFVNGNWKRNVHVFEQLIERKMKLMKGNKENMAEEMDKEKFKKLISEYKKFKMNSFKHLRFNSVANTAKFGRF